MSLISSSEHFLTSQLSLPIAASDVSSAMSGDDNVEACSWWFCTISFFATTSITVLYVIYAISLEDWTWKVASMFLPVAISCMVISVFLRPKDKGAGLKILHLQFYTFTVGSEVASSVGCFRVGLIDVGVFALLRLPLFWVAYALGLKLRHKAAQVSVKELINYQRATLIMLSALCSYHPQRFLGS